MVEGMLNGFITETQAGVGGFGYDPVFYGTEVGKTLAELTTEEKTRISHRGRAVRRLKELLMNVGA